MFQVPAAKVCSIGFQTWIQLRSIRLAVDTSQVATAQRMAQPGSPEFRLGHAAADHHDVGHLAFGRVHRRACCRKSPGAGSLDGAL